jgi:dihydrodipicolinate synthase/N-acetylneuraminate lyase
MRPAESDSLNLGGVYAALMTPVDDRGHPDAKALGRLIDFVAATGIDGVCLGGGTGEYPHFSLEDRKGIVALAARRLRGQLPFLVSIGAPTVRNAIDLGRHALEQGCGALLLPMPYFYRYEQEDMAACVRTVVRTLDAPCLLYNLAAFTNPLSPDTAIALLRSEPNVVGLKESSGETGALSRISRARNDAPWALFCGSDALALDALGAGWNGLISGIASCCPELLVALYRHHVAGRNLEAQKLQALLNELVAAVDRLPFPWSIRIAADVRGIPTGSLPWPLSPKRELEVRDLRTFYDAWFSRNLPLFVEQGAK